MANRWLRLFNCCLAVVVCAGLIPGQSLSVELLLRSGVSGHKCTEEGSELGCESQHAQVSAGFSTGRMVSLMSLLPGGILFDRYGGRCVAVMGAGLAIFGMLLVTVPLYGAAHGYDESTSCMLPAALLFSDVGAVLSSFCLYSVFWHFPKMQTVIAALMIGTYNSAGVLPNILEYIMSVSGERISLLQMIICDIAVMLFAGLLCFLFVPDLEESRLKATEVLGVPLPRRADDCSLLGDLRRAHAVLRVHGIDNLFFCMSMSVAFVFNVLYTSFLGTYVELMLESKTAAQSLPGLQIIILAVLGSTISPLLSVLADFSNRSPQVLSVLLSCTCLVCSATVLEESWLSQIICMTCTALFQSFFVILVTVRSLSFCLPVQFGTVNGVLYTYIVVVTMVLLFIAYAAIQAAPSELPHIMFYTSALSSLGMTVGSARLLLHGVPKGPVLTSGEEAVLAEPFGCQTLREVLYKMQLEDTGDSSRSGEPLHLQGLINWIGTDGTEFDDGSSSCKDAIASPVSASATPATKLHQESCKDAIVRPVSASATTSTKLHQESNCRGQRAMKRANGIDEAQPTTTQLLQREGTSALRAVYTAVDLDDMAKLFAASNESAICKEAELDLDDMTKLPAASNEPAICKEAELDGVPDEPSVEMPSNTKAPQTGHPGNQMMACAAACDSGMKSRIAWNRCWSQDLAMPNPTQDGSSSTSSMPTGSSTKRQRKRGAAEPLLGRFASPFAGNAVPSVDSHTGGRAKFVRSLNRRLLEMVRTGDKAAILDVYEKEHPQILLEAYCDMVDNVFPDREALDRFKREFDFVCPQQDFKELIRRRPALSPVMESLLLGDNSSPG